jgi:hypothetical protein
MKTLFACLAALPFLAQGEPIYVQYEGRVLRIDERDGPVEGYEVGDFLSGTLVINPDLAPLHEPTGGFLEIGGFEGSNFVTGFARGGPAQDFVGIYPAGHRGPGLPGLGRYDVNDSRYPMDSGQWISIGASSAAIKDATLFQTIDVKEGEKGSFMSGVIGLGRAAGQVLLGLTRFSVTPGRCRP